MKNLLSTIVLVACAASVFTACQKDDNKGKLDPSAMISLRPADGVPSGKATEQHLNALEIVKQAANIKWYNKAEQDAPMARTFSDAQKDSIAPKLMMFSVDIISQQGEYDPDFIEGEDIIITRWNEPIQREDTIAYVPNSDLRTAQPLIKSAFDAGDYATCYDIFNKALTFKPITGEEWRTLKAEGKN